MKKKKTALLRATKSMKEYERFEIVYNFFHVGESFAGEFLCR